MPAKRSVLEELLAEQMAAEPCLPAPVEELVFHPTRKWRFDFAWPARSIAVEVEGQGRHQTFKGFEDDCVKYGEAALLGWTVLRFNTRMVKDGRALDFIRRALLEEV